MMKSTFHFVTFSNRVTGETGSARDIVPGWDMGKEVRRRMWLDFWDGLVMGCFSKDTDMVRRFVELKHTGEEKG